MKATRPLRRWLAFGLLLVAGAATAAAPERAVWANPQPRVDHDMHSARINQMRATPDGTQLLTVSDDKTVRVWRLGDLAPLRTLRVPSLPGAEGALRALAITRDGHVFVGGWTGRDWGRGGALYRFEIGSGRLLQTYGGFTGSIESLAISPDGRRLAVGLGGSSGLHVIDTRSGSRLWQDTAYAERVSFIDFAPDGRLATTSQDGCLRLYDAEGRLTVRADFPPPAQPRARVCLGGELGGVRFSLDGRRLAIGVQDRPVVGILDAVTGATQQLVRVDDPLQQSLCCIAWAPDGQTLFINGAHVDEDATPLYRLSPPAWKPVRAASGRQRFTNMVPLADGGIVIASNAPSLLRLSADGSRVAERHPPNGDFRFEWRQLQVDANAERLVLPMDAAGRDRRQFSLTADPARALRTVESGDDEGLSPPDRGPAQQVTAVLDAYGYKHPVQVNGHAVTLRPFQSVRSWAAGGGRVALGTQWSVLVTDPQGRTLWEQELPAPAYQITVSGNGRWVVAAVGDGSLRWYAADTGHERLGAFLHVNGQDWIAWRPDGFYASSPGGDEFLGWLVNRGDEREPDFLRAVQFERTLYRPDLVRAALSEGPAAREPTSGLGDRLAALAAPRVRIESISVETRQVRFSVQPNGSPVHGVGVYADGIPVLNAEARRVGDGASAFVRTVGIPPGLPLDRIRVEAESARALGLDEVASPVPQAAVVTGRGRLWVLAIGVEKFDQLTACSRDGSCNFSVRELPNAPSDASVIAALLGERSGGAFSEVRTRVLAHRVGRLPTKGAILSALRELEAARPEDTVFVFLGSHGFAGGGETPEYYFLPADARSQSLDVIFAEATGRAAPPGATTASLLSATELNEAMRRVPGRRMLAIDTCHAGAAGVSSNPFSLAKRSAAAQYAVLAASTGDELSFEVFDGRVPHGSFTHALIRALRGAADLDGNGLLTLDEAFRFIGPEVQRNVERINAARRRIDPRHRDHTQTPTLYASPAVRVSHLAAVPSTPGR